MLLVNRFKPHIFHPLVVLSVSLGVAFLAALVVMARYSPGTRFWPLYYSVPIVVPFVAYLFDRAEQWHKVPKWQWYIEVPIILLAITRNFVAVPFLSGHALFLTFALLTTSSWVARLTALLVFLQVAQLKIFMWGDIGIVGAILLGMFAALAIKLLRQGDKVSRA